MNLKKQRIQNWPLILVFLLLPSLLYAFSFEPISAVFSPSGREATKSFLLKNETDEFTALRISLFERSVDINGKETRIPADHLFLVYPSRIVLPPESVQTLRVKWQGDSTVSAERAFRILVEQVPVEFENQESRTSGLQIMFRYLGSIYITPKDAFFRLEVENTKILRTPEGAAKLEFTVANTGTRHVILEDLRLEIGYDSQNGRKILELFPEELKGIAEENILAGARRRFLLELPPGVTGDSADVQIRHNSN